MRHRCCKHYILLMKPGHNHCCYYLPYSIWLFTVLSISLGVCGNLSRWETLRKIFEVLMETQSRNTMRLYLQLFEKTVTLIFDKRGRTWDLVKFY
jgi:hypothetical protein